jgi:hypothetical protein
MSGVHCFSTAYGREGLGRIGLFRKGFVTYSTVLCTTGNNNVCQQQLLASACRARRAIYEVSNAP